MGDDKADAARGGRSRFLKKSNWGKVFKENDSPSPTGKVNSFKLNEDVVDFLKPSTDKSSTRPTINIAVAQRWPETHEIRRASEANTPPVAIQQTFAKPKRRKGLTVGFVKTAPEIIGEGGDEAPDPPSEVSRRKSMIPRSVSARQSNAVPDGTQWPGTQAARQQPPRQAHAPGPTGHDLRPPPVRRVQTSHNEFSAPVQRKHASPRAEEVPPHRPTLGRMPTGYGSLDDEHTTPHDTPVDHQEHRYSPVIQTTFDDTETGPPYDSAVPARAEGRSLQPVLNSSNPLSMVMRKQRDQRANEGMALRRASALYMTDGAEARVRDNASTGIQPPSEFYNALSEPNAPERMPESVGTSERTLLSDSAHKPDGPSPFADPKYMEKRACEMPTTQPLRQPRAPHTPSYMQAKSFPYPEPQPSSHRTQRSLEGVPPVSYMQRRLPAQSGARQAPSEGKPSYMYASQPHTESMEQSRAPPQPSTSMSVLQDSSRSRSRSPMRDRIFDSQPMSDDSKPLYSQPDHSSGSMNHFAPTSTKSGHSRSDSHESNLPQSSGSANPGRHSPRQPRARAHKTSQSLTTDSSMLGLSHPNKASLSPNTQTHSPADYFSAPKSANNNIPPRSPAANLRQEEAGRPGSSGSTRMAYRPQPSPQPPAHGDPAADIAFADFAARVAHMKGVFRLTAEKERPADKCTPSAWLRAALWWYLRGKAGLEVMLQQRPRSPEGKRELLVQAHVDLAKAWWILSDPLEPYDTVEGVSPPSAHPGDNPNIRLQGAVARLHSYLKSLSLQMVRNQLMPPHQSLIQGQDTQIWLDYPRFTTDAATVLSGNASMSRVIESTTHATDPLDALPLGDNRNAFCYGRFPVEVSVNTDEQATDRVVLPCMLSMLRGTRDYQTTIVISSQNELVNVRVGPRQQNERGLIRHDVSWKASSQSLAVHLPRGFDLTVRMQETDFRSLWNLAEYARKVEHSLRPEADEKLVHEARLAELQYADSSGSKAFPHEKIRGCLAVVYEKVVEHRDASGLRKKHNGYRVLLVTDPNHKSLSSVSHELCRGMPLSFELITDAAASGSTAMVIRVREESRQCRILLVFPDVSSRQALYNVLNGLTVGPDESVVGKMAVTGVNIQTASQTEGFTPVSHPALQDLQWQRLGVTNGHPEDPNSRIPETVESENLRVLARHAAGCITDRLNMSKGELMIRIPCADTATPVVQILRGPQRDLTMSIDVRVAPQHVVDGITELLQLAREQSTIRTFSFANSAELHAFQAAITGFTVTYDGVASSFGISRRMMVVSIHHVWQASKVRLQVVSKSGIVQVLAFMEDFSHADAMCFQVKSTDTFESVKGDGKGKKWAVKIKDAKFSLPRREKSEVDEEERVRKRFVNLEGLDYAEEHDDITVGFETEEDRDKFAKSLPAATTVSRMITLKRRI